ncbi:MAG: hypothetical protein OXS32_02715 [Verrucomicrobiales bacterium]|nr:hypothetical protein [Verrucomicrobiales bacterium]
MPEIIATNLPTGKKTVKASQAKRLAKRYALASSSSAVMNDSK